MKRLFTFTLVYFLIHTSIFSDGFLRTKGRSIVDGNGTPLLLRGMGLGGWLLQEGYMLQTSGFANAEHEIRAKIQSLVGETKTQELYDVYHANYVTKKDIDQLAEWGFNSIRLPMHYNKLTPLGQTGTYIEKGFAMIDSLLSWCEQNKIYLILDLHGAPGGQSDEPISDYDNTKPSLWESEDNKLQTIALWGKLAERYKDKEWIGGYDLINEPKWNLGSKNEQLKDLYVRITDEIRKVDTNHIIFIEGNWYATDFNGLTPPWDDNLVYSFHKYWNDNTQGTINYLVSISNTHQVPLWLGESGENSNSWFTDCVKLMEANNIGWAWWPHKKIDHIAGPLSAPRLSGYDLLLKYWSGQGSKPSETLAYTYLLQQFQSLAIDKCRIQYDVVDALTRQPYEDGTIPYADNNIPGIIYAVNYDIGKLTQAYYDKTHQNVGGGAYNNGYSYRNDGVDIEKCTDSNTNGFNVGWTETGDWLKFTVNVEFDGTYDLNLRYAAGNSGGKISLKFDDNSLFDFKEVPVTGGWQNWQTMTIEALPMTKGTHELKIYFYFGGFNINYLMFWPNTVGINEDVQSADDFTLEQNYPNPFNPSTVIKFRIPNYKQQNKNSVVSLIVFDILGREVQTLVNEFKAPGKYEINFNANTGSSIASGIYFYQLKIGSFSEVKKMILLE
ncbi:MAG: cellulase family glycosylhydrolase [Bacteroidetes bacterium]|nr:cellulase family glycosylhydrolase [Bacteroidota bacterium]